MLPRATLPSAGDLPADPVPADEDAGEGSAIVAARPRGQVRADRRRTRPRDAAASLREVSELGCLWRDADGKVTQGAVPGNGTVVIGAAAGRVRARHRRHGPGRLRRAGAGLAGRGDRRGRRRAAAGGVHRAADPRGCAGCGRPGPGGPQDLAGADRTGAAGSAVPPGQEHGGGVAARDRPRPGNGHRLRSARQVLRQRCLPSPRAGGAGVRAGRGDRLAGAARPRRRRHDGSRRAARDVRSGHLRG